MYIAYIYIYIYMYTLIHCSLFNSCFLGRAPGLFIIIIIIIIMIIMIIIAHGY